MGITRHAKNLRPDPNSAAWLAGCASGDGDDRRLLLRLCTFGLLASVWLLLILVRLFDLQITQSDRFAEKAHQQQEGVIEVRATRGAIYDRFGEELALSTPVDSIGVFPSKVRNPQFTSTLLSEVLRIDSRILNQKLARTRFQWVKRLAEPGEAERVRNLGLPGLHFEKESKRYYPKGTVASHLLGAVGIDHQGQAGLEQSFEGLLHGRSGQQLLLYDALRNHYASRTIQEPVPGADLILTIDQRVQMVAERELSRAIEQTQAGAGTIVVMDPKNGDLAALANWPTFNPNDRVASTRDLERRRNYAVSNLIEPGSTFKMITIAAALEEGLTTPDEVLDCQMGAITLGWRRIRDHKPFGMLTVAEILAKSSNVGAIKLGLRLGPARMLEYARRFGFGKKAGLPLPGETAGMVRPLEKWNSDSIGSVAIGQEVGVTALQMARAVAAVANGGLLVTPRLVEAIVHSDGRRELLDPDPARRILSSKTAAIMRALSENVVKSGTGRRARTPGYRVGGKTGTAQKIDPETGGYSPTEHIASFIGMAPINDPAIVVAIVLDSPVEHYHGGQVAAPVFPPVAVQALRFRDVPPELPIVPQSPREQAVPEELLVDFAEEPWEKEQEVAEAVLDGSPAEILVATTGRHAAAVEPPQQATEQASDSEAPEAVLRVTDRVVPDFKGHTFRQVLTETTELGLRVDVRGRGLVRRQWPLAGTPIAPGSTVKLEFAEFKMVVADR